MRPIKFRAWDKVDKKVRKVMSLDFYNTRQSEVTLASDGDVYLRYFEQIELMQYTGLKDKNGQEIYEGDICKLTSKERYSNHYFTVDEDWETTYVVHYDDYMYLFKEIKDEYEEILLWAIDENSIDVEVLGNVFENPELMKGRQ